MKFTNQRITGYVFRLLWLVGLWIFAQIAFMSILPPRGRMTYQSLHHQLFIGFAVYCALGVYLAILFVQHWRFTPNIPLLVFVFLPCAVVSISHPFLRVTSPLWVQKVNTMGISSITTGVSLILGLFGAKNSKTPTIIHQLEPNRGETT